MSVTGGSGGQERGRSCPTSRHGFSSEPSGLGITAFRGANRGPSRGSHAQVGGWQMVSQTQVCWGPKPWLLLFPLPGGGGVHLDLVRCRRVSDHHPQILKPFRRPRNRVCLTGTVLSTCLLVSTKPRSPPLQQSQRKGGPHPGPHPWGWAVCFVTCYFDVP